MSIGDTLHFLNRHRFLKNVDSLGANILMYNDILSSNNRQKERQNVFIIYTAQGVLTTAPV